LRKSLRMARRWNLIRSVPEIPRLKGETRTVIRIQRKHFGRNMTKWPPEPLNSFVQLSCEISICEGEMVDLLKADVHLSDKADEWGHYG